MKLCLLFIITLTWFAAWTNAQEERAPLPRIIPVEDCSDVCIWTPAGWILHIRSDGSAHLQFGSSPLDGVSLPAGGFSFPEIHRKFAALRFDGVDFLRDPSIAFRQRDATTAYGLSTSDHQTIKTMFQMIKAKVNDFDHQGRLGKIWADHPPIP